MSATTSLPPYSENVIPGLIGSSTVFLVLALIAFALRVYIRLRPCLRWGWDDWAMTLSVVGQINTSCICTTNKAF